MSGAPLRVLEAPRSRRRRYSELRAVLEVALLLGGALLLWALLVGIILALFVGLSVLWPW